MASSDDKEAQSAIWWWRWDRHWTSLTSTTVEQAALAVSGVTVVLPHWTFRRQMSLDLLLTCKSVIFHLPYSNKWTNSSIYDRAARLSYLIPFINYCLLYLVRSRLSSDVATRMLTDQPIPFATFREKLYSFYSVFFICKPLVLNNDMLLSLNIMNLINKQSMSIKGHVSVTIWNLVFV